MCALTQPWREESSLASQILRTNEWTQKIEIVRLVLRHVLSTAEGMTSKYLFT